MSTITRIRQRGGVGERVQKVDGVPKVRGAFEYASDMVRENVLFAATVRSSRPHALLRSVDISAALALPGVRAVLTAADVPGRKRFGVEVADQPVLAFDRVRYVGEPIAIVAAVDAATARAAVEAVVVDYHDLDVVSDPKRALESPPLHDDPPHEPAWSPDDRPNVIRTVQITHGDPDATGDVAVSSTYELGRQDPAFLGPEAGIAIPDGAGGVDIHVATQWLHQDLHQVTACLGLDEDRVRIHLAGVGGAFGGREDLSGQVHSAMLALRTGLPVRFSYMRDESFVGHVHRHPAIIEAEHHATRDGTLVCVRMRVVLDGGAYASGSPAVTFNASTMAVGPYVVPNADLCATTVYTNNPPAGAMRGFGVVQVCHAHEAQMDALATMLGMDPAELRLKNALSKGHILPTGEVITGPLPVAETIAACLQIPVPPPAALPREPVTLPGGIGNVTRGEGVRHGVGLAVAYKNVAYSGGYDDSATARIRLIREADGVRAEVHSAAVEFGQGLTNVHVQVVRQELDVEWVDLVTPTTAGPGSSGSTSASRQTWMTAGALRMCCSALRDELAARGGELELGEELDVTRRFHHAKTSPVDPVTGQVPPGERAHVAYGAVAMRAAVEVDVDLGLVRVCWIGVAQDVGKALNPTTLEGQIEGGVVQGLGLAVMEEVVTIDGVIRNGSFTDYLIPTMLDVPPIDIAMLELPHPEAPYGLKGIGEAPAIVATAAIAAAIRDATGLPLTRVPIGLDAIALSEVDA